MQKKLFLEGILAVKIIYDEYNILFYVPQI